ncbi:extracellular solute-binding protein [Siculibacillus lacustris]|uniref:extracellular solute-binding protein n=1 Tax=Siculibacillus lacustris TaxID=1549641 RepID=UPI0013F14673|nr:extracellular solute-binding protein [Siculibacillus lacustris]
MSGARGPTRRAAIGGALGLIAAAASGRPAAALTLRHGLSAYGDLKYPVDFRHFDWVDPRAPKGGRLSTVPSSWALNQNPTTFNSLNGLILKGDAAVGSELIYDSLMVRALDEPDAVYGLVASAVEISDDGRTHVFHLRREARFHDGSPLDAEDVAFSLTTLKALGHPLIAEPLREMDSVEVLAPDRVAVHYTAAAGRTLPLAVAVLPILSKRHWTSRDFSASTLEPPLGSGAYRIGRFDPGRFIEYERVADWWAKDLPVAVGQANFDVIRYEMYRERTTAFEAFKAGQYLLREEATSSVWATQYDFPAAVDGRVKRIELEDLSPSGAQGWFLNTRREIFRDARVREAIGLAFDFEWSNKNLFFDSYRRTPSFFVNSDLEATGLPSPQELALLEPHRARLSPAVFETAWRPPVSDGSGRDRKLLKRASDLLAAAGWTRRGEQLVDAGGRPFAIEFLESDSGLDRVLGPFQKNLGALGITATTRLVDPSQYEKRLRDFDFDVVSRRYAFSPTLDEGLRQFWHSSSATRSGSNNLAGIADPAVDTLLETALGAATRAEMTVAARALDRVLRSGHWWVPCWYKASNWIAAWDVFGRPAVKPRYDRGILATWWVDRTRATALGKGL